MEPTKEDRPDFERVFSIWFKKRYSIELNPITHWSQIIAGDLKEFWNDYVISRDQEIERLKKGK